MDANEIRGTKERTWSSIIRYHHTFPAAGISKIRNKTSHAGSPLEVFIAVNDDNMCTDPNKAHKDNYEYVLSSKYIISGDSDDENEMNNAVLVTTSSEMKNVMKSIYSY
ncbi:hypothetical protein TNCV_2849131 [Trichonephila clavipes]|nr:hypothetical protein TNCV_2849131 [Trichonephila clavipes]